MCGRFVSSTPAAVLADQFAAEAVPDLPDAPRYNVAPTDQVLAVAASAGGRRLGTLSWGLVPRWADEGRAPRRLVNLRAETVAARPAFRAVVARRRCIVPADGFYEWAGERGRGRRQPVFVTARDRRPLAFAGVWD
ncbi:MAG: SOS response-associated peptidase, partial [Actinomycetota bacterium]|nr:SOS response-associated peptidase [Actinomycetota bacterium]